MVKTNRPCRKVVGLAEREQDVSRMADAERYGLISGYVWSKRWLLLATIILKLAKFR